MVPVFSEANRDRKNRLVRTMGTSGKVKLCGMLFALMLLTALDGKPVWVESTAVVIIRTQSNECQKGHGSVIRVGSMGLCVRETPDEIRAKIKDADGHP
jgi:hypothetical protein